MNIVPISSRDLYSCQMLGHKNLWTEFRLDKAVTISKARKLDKFWFYLTGKSNFLVEKAIY